MLREEILVKHSFLGVGVLDIGSRVQRRKPAGIGEWQGELPAIQVIKIDPLVQTMLSLPFKSTNEIVVEFLYSTVIYIFVAVWLHRDNTMIKKHGVFLQVNIGFEAISRMKPTRYCLSLATPLPFRH
jgi:hypothetical protein